MRPKTIRVSSAAPTAMVRLDNYATAVLGVQAVLAVDGTETTPGNLFPINGLNFVNAAQVAKPAIVAPDGSIGSVALMQEDTANDTHQMYDYYNTPNPHTAMISAYLQAAGRRYFQLMFSDSGGVMIAYAIFDLARGVVTDKGASAGTTITPAVSPAPNGWWKCALSCSANPSGNAITYLIFALCDRATLAGGPVDPYSDPLYQGDGVSGAYFWKIAATSSATLAMPQFTIDGTFDNPNEYPDGVPVGSVVWDASMMPAGAVAGYGSMTFVIAAAPLWARLRLIGSVGAARATFLQVGNHSHSNITAGPFAPHAAEGEAELAGSNFRAMGK